MMFKISSSNSLVLVNVLSQEVRQMLRLVQVTFQELLNFWKFRGVLCLLILFQNNFLNWDCTCLVYKT